MFIKAESAIQNGSVPKVERQISGPVRESQSIKNRICAELCIGKSLRTICSEEAFPNLSTVMRWLAKDSEFREQYAETRKIQAELLSSEIIEIADDGKNDTYVDGEGRKLTDYDVIARSRLRVDARKWIASKLLPKVYGEKGTEVSISNTVNNITVSAEQMKAIQEAKQRLQQKRQTRLSQ